ncbi:DNA repair and recombination protein RadB, partial [mine drainage metagenome]
MNGRRLPFGVETLDALLDGGIEAGSLTQLYGEGGSGKTNLCLALSVEAALEGRWTIYLDTEGLSLARLDQMGPGKRDHPFRGPPPPPGRPTPRTSRSRNAPWNGPARW